MPTTKAYRDSRKLELSHEYVKECFDYDPETGLLTWRHRPQSHFPTENSMKSQNGKFAGKVAGTISKEGYVHIHLKYRLFLGHRIAWLMHYGSLPDRLIDHINGITSDNRICNLRQCDARQNMWNKRRSSHNRSGFKGVTLSQNGKYWSATIRADGKPKHLGRYPNAELAHAAYCQAAEQIYGEFANHG